MPAKDSKITDPNYLACLAKAREKALLVRKQKAAERQEIQAAANFEHQQKLTAAREKLGTSKPATTEGTKSDPIQPTKPAKTEKTEKTKAKPKKKPEPEPEPESESEAETSETESESSVESEPPPPRHKKSSKPSRSAPEPQQKPSRSDSHRPSPSADDIKYMQLHRSLFGFR